MKRERFFILAGLFLIAVSVGILLFSAGWIMGESNYRQRLAASKSRKDISDALVEWQQSGDDVTSKPIFFVAKGIAWLKNEKHPDSVKVKAALQNLEKALILMGN